MFIFPNNISSGGQEALGGRVLEKKNNMMAYMIILSFLQIILR